jgi:hypothetical protein
MILHVQKTSGQPISSYYGYQFDESIKTAEVNTHLFQIQMLHNRRYQV